MAKPNKTVGRWRQKHGFPPRDPKPVGPFMEWVAQQAREGASFATIEEAQAAYEKAVSESPRQP